MTISANQKRAMQRGKAAADLAKAKAGAERVLAYRAWLAAGCTGPVPTIPEKGDYSRARRFDLIDQNKPRHKR